MRRTAFFFSMRRCSLLETNQRLRRTVLRTPLFTTFLRKRLSRESCDSPERKFTDAKAFHLLPHGRYSIPGHKKTSAQGSRGSQQTCPTNGIGTITFIRAIAVSSTVLIIGQRMSLSKKTCGRIIHRPRALVNEKPLGNDLLSQEAALQVPSALTGLTTGFGMLPGVPPSLKSPRDVFTT